MTASDWRTFGVRSTVGDLRLALVGLPDDMPLEIVYDCHAGLNSSPLDRVEVVEVDSCGAPPDDGLVRTAWLWTRKAAAERPA